MYINKGVELSVCLPQKLHKKQFPNILLATESIFECLEALRPCLSLLLLVDTQDLLAQLSTEEAGQAVLSPVVPQDPGFGHRPVPHAGIPAVVTSSTGAGLLSSTPCVRATSMYSRPACRAHTNTSKTEGKLC